MQMEKAVLLVERINFGARFLIGHPVYNALIRRQRLSEPSLWLTKVYLPPILANNGTILNLKREMYRIHVS